MEKLFRLRQITCAKRLFNSELVQRSPLYIPEEHPDDEYCFRELASNPSVSETFKMNNADAPWHPKPEKIVCDMTPQSRARTELVFDTRWGWYKFSEYVMSECDGEELWEFVKENPRRDWSWKALSSIASWDFIDAHIDKSWDFEVLSCREDIDMNVIARHQDVFCTVSANPAFCFEDVRDLNVCHNMLLTNPMHIAQNKWIAANRPIFEVLERVFPGDLIIEIMQFFPKK